MVKFALHLGFFQQLLDWYMRDKIFTVGRQRLIFSLKTRPLILRVEKDHLFGQKFGFRNRTLVLQCAAVSFDKKSYPYSALLVCKGRGSRETFFIK